MLCVRASFVCGTHLQSLLCSYFQKLSTAPGDYVCDQPGCTASFKSVRAYQIHMKRHLGLFQYQCPYCDRSFSSGLNIKEHLRDKHTGIHGFYCVHCKVEMQNLYWLKEHLKHSSCAGRNQDFI